MIPFSSTIADTWGIGSTAFLGGYAFSAITAFTMTVLVRRILRSGPAHRDNPRLAGDDAHTAHLAAYLNGGATLAVLSALSSLRTADTLAASGARHCVRTSIPTDIEFTTLERAVLTETATPVSRSELVDRPAVADACRKLRADLIDRGLLLSDRRRRALRVAVLPLLAVLVLGVLRVIAGALGGKSVAYIVILTGLVAIAALLLLKRVPTRTWRGDANLDRLRHQHDELSPSMRPNWNAHGPAAAALAVGVFGAGALWAADPRFAEELEVAAASASGGGWGGSGWGGGSGGGSYWGGGSSCGGGGSSCGGGGGGCGGGGGGCGG